MGVRILLTLFGFFVAIALLPMSNRSLASHAPLLEEGSYSAATDACETGVSPLAAIGTCGKDGFSGIESPELPSPAENS